jgi:LuxR family maltose regulon positive regulatory protein
MARKEHQTTPVVTDGILYTDDEHTGLRVGSAAWFTWLAAGRTFYLSDPGITLRNEPRRNGYYWYAYKRIDRKLLKRYAGRADTLTVDTLAGLFSPVEKC